MTKLNEFNQILGSEVPNWSGVKKPTLKIMQGNYCVLEVLDIDKHGEKLYQALNKDNKGESWTYLPIGPFATSKEFNAWLKQFSSKDDTLVYVVLDINSKQPLGMASYLRMEPTHGVIEVGAIHYSKELKNTAAATEVMYLMMAYVFDDLHYRRYEWKCNTLNEASKSAALRLGFKFEGIFRQSNVFKNRNRDTAWYSIIDSEWPDIKKRFQAWLSPDNFDAEGKQIKRICDIIP